MEHIISFPGLGLNFTVNRAVFSIGSFPIYWYGLLIAIGFILAVVYGAFECKKVGISHDDFFNMLLISIPVSVIFARLYYVVFNFGLYKDDLASVINIRNGGLAVYGGIIGAFIVIFVYCKIKKISLGKILDILAVGLLIGQAIGRWGNFINGEAFGYSTAFPWAMNIKEDGVTVASSVHPTFLYESLWNALGILVLLLLKKHKKFNGELFCDYLIWYGFGRFFIEGLRTDSLYIASFRVSQILSAILFVVGIIIIIINRKKCSKNNND